MNAYERARANCTPSNGVAHAIYFRSESDLLFGWLHYPASAASNLGLVICNPFGYEATCSHRSIRTFAETAAKLDIPSLRFDYRGTGDSADLAEGEEQLEAWVDNVLAAVAEMRRATGVQRVCVLGIRLGGLLAMLASRRSEAIDSLILIAPVLQGQRYLRQLRMTRLASTLGGATAPAAASAIDPRAPLGVAEMEVSGFTLSAAAQRALADLDMSGVDSPHWPKMLIIDGDTLPTSRAWAERLAATSPNRFQYLALPGLIEMTMRSPMRATVPTAMVAAACDWLAERMMAVGPTSAGNTAVPIQAAEPPASVMPLEYAGPGQTVTERPVFIPSDAMLFGIVTEPRGDERRRRGVILLNTGADNHIGASRMHVTLARRWARHGYVVLRLDLGGLGDSTTGPGCRNDEVFPEAAMDEIRAAIEYLRVHYGVENITVGGVCSGAYHALRAAVAELPVNQVFLVNPQNYFWKKGMRIDELHLAEVVQKPTLYVSQLFSRNAWNRLLHGDVSLVRIFRIYVNRILLAFESTLRELARRLTIALPQDLGAELRTICDRGVRVLFV
ncbi:MAG TPA: alpha/beta fold hydrolase, partial [Gemmataceae bacterium]|nr:alpha/beta fold hydrolase [Gemmataceae bacterium]